ncbi:lipid phosphate phosphatase epsilon 1, chloroplastic isoform X2 [Gastrolobium bilobum]|uniref:lipid phosphate phosphatase epsilon 1, chloroplastic isoform X2 n=1 Tax=Gastrolobium bilobum TaxID=150636 RepID=UPI002AB07E72|nr:lipid phosphate phosphatase epsilon 1, chloroplastic isoform X2 [Gastrolobium bilobum]
MALGNCTLSFSWSWTTTPPLSPMSATALICHNPSSYFLGSNLLKQRYFKNNSFSASRSFLCRGFVPRKPVLGRNTLWVSNNMNESTGTSAFRDGKSDDNIQVLEQEAFIDGTSEFQPKFLSQEVESTLNRLSKWIVASLYGGFILWRHDAEALWFAGGSVLNALLSVLLKHILNQERPSTLKSDPGMPSTHAQSIFFTVFFVILSKWLGLNGLTIAISALMLAFGSFFSYLRVSQRLHTMSQVLVGAAIGSIFSILWYWLWNGFMLHAFVSSLWVRIIVVLVSAGLCLGFVLFAIRYWLQNE